MKYIKQFENGYGLREGDYVICDEEEDISPAYNFIKNNIGIFLRIIVNSNNEEYYAVQYSNVPKELKMYFEYHNMYNVRPMFEHEIRYWSNNREELESILSANKYNL